MAGLQTTVKNSQP